jgi:DNA-binding LacI/PurR family transcriptional regulator
VEEELKKFGFHLVFSNFNDSSTEIPRMLKNSAVDGVIITGEVPPHLLNFLQKNKISHVLMAHSIKYDGKSDIVASDERDIGYKAANYLLKKHRRLALIRGGESFRPHDVLRGDGFIQALAEYGRKFDAGMLVECNSYDPAEIRKKISTLLKKDRPDAIFATNINFLNEAVPVFCNSGIRIPEDLEFVIFSGPGTLRLNIPEPVVVKTDSKEISRAAVNRLLDMICGRAVGISINLIPAVLSKNVFLNNKQL